MYKSLGTISISLLCFAAGFSLRSLFVEAAPSESTQEAARSNKPHPTQAPTGSRTATRGPESGSGLEALSAILYQNDRAAYLEAMAAAQLLGLRNQIETLSLTDYRKAFDIVKREPTLLEDQEFLAKITRNIATQDPRLSLDIIESQKPLMEQKDYNWLLASALGPMATKDPEFAASLLHKLPFGNGLKKSVGSIAQAWGEQDPDSALKWLDSLIDKGLPTETLNHSHRLILSGRAQIDPMGTAKIIANLGSSSLNLTLVPEIALKLGETDLSDAIGWLDSFPDLDARTAGFRSVISVHASRDPERLMNALASPELGGAIEPSLTKLALDQIAKADPPLLMSNFGQLPAHLQSVAASSVVDALLQNKEENSSELVEKWLRQIPPGRTLDEAAKAYALNSVDSNPSSALKWLAQISDPELKTSAIQAIARDASIDSILSVESALSSLSPESETLNELNETLARRIVEEYAYLQP